MKNNVAYSTSIDNLVNRGYTLVKAFKHYTLLTKDTEEGKVDVFVYDSDTFSVNSVSYGIMLNRTLYVPAIHFHDNGEVDKEKSYIEVVPGLSCAIDDLPAEVNALFEMFGYYDQSKHCRTTSIGLSALLATRR